MATPRSADAPEGPPPKDAAAVAAVAAAVLGAVLSLAALGIYGSRAALSVAVGAIIAVANLVTMSAIIRALLKPPDETDAPAANAGNASPEPTDEPREPVDHRAEGKRGGAAWGLFAAIKILVLFGGIWILLTRGLVDPIPLVVGYGVLPMGIAASGLLTSLAPRRRSKK